MRGRGFSRHVRITSSRGDGIDAYGVRGFGSAMLENKFSVAAFALHAIPAGSSVKSLQYWNDIPEEI